MREDQQEEQEERAEMQTSAGEGPQKTHTAWLYGEESAPALRRRREGRMIGGVAAGIARYFSVDTAVVRIAFVVFAFAGGLGIPAYIAAWLLIPEEGAGESIAEDWLDRYPRRAA
jgi:phage shock protein PspC (stress-responsive transcriptional regulator)